MPSPNLDYDDTEFYNLSTTASRHRHQNRKPLSKQTKKYSSKLSNVHYDSMKFYSLPPSPRHCHQDRKLQSQHVKRCHSKLQSQLQNAYYNDIEFNSLPSLPRHSHENSNMHGQEKKTYSSKALDSLNKSSRLNNYSQQFSSLESSYNEFLQSNNIINEKNPKSTNSNDKILKDLSFVKLFKLPFSCQPSLSFISRHWPSKNQQKRAMFKQNPYISPHLATKSLQRPPTFKQHPSMLPDLALENPQRPLIFKQHPSMALNNPQKQLTFKQHPSKQFHIKFHHTRKIKYRYNNML